MMKALVLNGAVVDTADTEFPVAPELTWHDIPPGLGVEHGWTFDGTFTSPPVVPPVDPADTPLTPDDNERLFLSLGLTPAQITTAKRAR